MVLYPGDSLAVPTQSLVPIAELPANDGLAELTRPVEKAQLLSTLERESGGRPITDAMVCHAQRASVSLQGDRYR